jgi:hypothetical protein
MLLAVAAMGLINQHLEITGAIWWISFRPGSGGVVKQFGEVGEDSPDFP